MIRKFIISSILAVITIFVVLLQSAGNGGSVEGVVKNQRGEPVVGAFVRVKNAERRLSVTVISRDLGRYNASDLPQGKYTVQGIGGGLQSEDATVEVDSARSATVNLVLTGPANYRGTIPITEMAALMPDGEGKTIILGECTHCHLNGVEEIVVQRKSHDGWTATIEKMENKPYGHDNSLHIEQKKREVVIDYLTQNFGPDLAPFDQNNLPKRLVQGAAAKSVVTEFFVPAGARPHDIAIDSKGICWVGESKFGVLGRYDPQTATYTRIPLPEGSWPEPIAVAPNDHVWIMDGHERHDGTPNARLIEYDPKTGKFTIYPISKPANAISGILHDIAFHPDGSVWGDMYHGRVLVRVDPATKEVTQYPVPAEPLYGLAFDGNGAVWVTEQMNGKLARVDSKGGHLKEFDLPTKDSMPQRMDTDANGNIWFGEYRSGKLAMIDYQTTKITEYPTPTKDSGAYGVTVDRTRNVIWLNEMMAAQIARFDPRTKTFLEYPLPTRMSSARYIKLDPVHPNRIWFAGYLRDNVGYLDVIE